MSEIENKTEEGRRKTCKSAILSFALALMLWFYHLTIFILYPRKEGILYGFLLLVYISSLLMSPIFGLVALVTIRKSKERFKGKGWAFAGIGATAVCFVFLFLGLRLHLAVCEDWDEIDSFKQKAIKSVSFEILEKMATGQYEKIWNSSHPILKKSAQKEQFRKAIENAQPLLTQFNNAEFIDGRLATIIGYKGRSHPLFFGLMDANSPDHLRAQSLAGAKQSAIAMIQINSQPIGRTVSLQMASDRGNFKLFRFDITATSYHNKNSKYYQEVAENLISKQKLLPAYIAHLTAVKLSQLGPTLKTGQSIKLEERLQELSKNPRLKNELTKWELPGKNYTLFGIGLVEVQDGILPRVRYLAHDELGDETSSKEAAALMEHVKAHSPELAALFDNILFEAYTENPISSKKQYNCYRTVLDFKS